MKKIRIMSVFGTRPEAIKMCPLVQELGRREGIESLCCVTAQHRQMLDSVLEVFQVKPDWDLDIMTPRQTLSTITSKCLTGMDEAIDFINAHGTQHSEAIITKNYFKAQHFLDQVDAAAVYVNASTRFTDGGEFGLGAEIGISTQKMHARGPMGLEELTSCKYVIYGEGQVR